MLSQSCLSSIYAALDYSIKKEEGDGSEQGLVNCLSLAVITCCRSLHLLLDLLLQIIGLDARAAQMCGRSNSSRPGSAEADKSNGKPV